MNVLSLLGSIIGLAGLTGAAAGFYRASRGQSVISLQKEEIDYYKNLALRNETERAAAHRTADNLRNINDQLLEKVQGSPQLISLTKEVKNMAEAITKLANNYEGRQK